ncbi:unnamed protein product, partial [Brenthis ino]
MKHILLNIILVFFFMIHHSTTEENARSGESYNLEDSTILYPLRYHVPNSEKPYEADTTSNYDAEANASNDKSSFHDRLKDLPYKVVMQLVNSGQEIGKGVQKTYQGKYLEGTIQSFGGINGLFKDSLTNTRRLIFGDN